MLPTYCQPSKKKKKKIKFFTFLNLWRMNQGAVLWTGTNRSKFSTHEKAIKLPLLLFFEIWPHNSNLLQLLLSANPKHNRINIWLNCTVQLLIYFQEIFDESHNFYQIRLILFFLQILAIAGVRIWQKNLNWRFDCLIDDQVLYSSTQYIIIRLYSTIHF